uniref:Uncharacterized protein n=1 Tax=Romanomermis culicivorax TaxID=13658 RepID=A0A915J406_ROMCU
MHYPPNINLNIEFFQLRTMQEMGLINFFGPLNFHITMAIRLRATNASLSLYQYFREHFHLSYRELMPPESHAVASLILQWVRPWAEQLGCIDAVHTAYISLFLNEAHSLDNPHCLIQAYNTAIGLIDSWIAYLQYVPFPLLPKTIHLYQIYLQYHSETNHPLLMLCRHVHLGQWNLLLP